MMTEEEKCRLVLGLRKREAQLAAKVMADIREERATSEQCRGSVATCESLLSFADIIENAPHPTINELGEWCKKRGIEQ